MKKKFKEPDYGYESPKPGQELTNGMLVVIFILVLLVILASAFSEEIDLLLNKYPIIVLVIFPPVIFWSVKRCWNKFIKP